MLQIKDLALEAGRYDGHSTHSNQENKKLLKRTRSLAVISEDESRQDPEVRHFRLGHSTFELPRRHQLIPRAKLIDRNSLKDRLSKSQQHLSDSYERFNEAKSYHSRSAFGLHSIPPVLESLPDPLPYTQGTRVNSDRLNILDWPEPPRRYSSVQALDTVSGLVDIVEDTWPIEGNRSIDCIYTQVKRKRKAHRSLDSILFEDDGELEYFDVLNLLPLSNVRLEFDEDDARHNSLLRKLETDPKASRRLDALDRRAIQDTPSSCNATDEEKCKVHIDSEESKSFEAKKETARTSWREEADKSSRGSKSSSEFDDNFERERSLDICSSSEITEAESTAINTEEDRFRADVAVVTVCEEVAERKVEEAEDYKSIWISDTEEQEDMSRRPQILKVVDSDVTKRRHRCNTVAMETSVVATHEDTKLIGDSTDGSSRVHISNGNTDKRNGTADESPTDDHQREPIRESGEKPTVKSARNFFERKKTEKEGSRNRQNEGRFERIVKETSNILGKACSAVKGTLGFEARSDSSDLGLGSESGSDSRRRSMDDGIDEDQRSGCVGKGLSSSESNDSKTGHANLARSRSCMDSIECPDAGQEFDHVRYKIVKSNMFGKSMFNGAKGDVTYEGLMHYLREYSFQELLLDNNVVIIEPVRAETIERKSTTNAKSKAENNCKAGGEVQKRSELERVDGKVEEGKSGRQSSIRKHFFYQPIRVNRELIDEELPDPDTVRNVRRMFENTLKLKSNTDGEFSRDCKSRKSVSMKDLSSIGDSRFEDTSEKTREASRSRCSSRAKDLTRLFESMDKSASNGTSVVENKDEPGSPRSESKTRILAQSFEARSGQTSPSNSTSSKNKMNRYHHHNWDSGSVSSGVSSDYPDTDPGSGVQCTSSEEEDLDCPEDDANDCRGHSVSQDVLKKIRECGTSVTYYGGKVVNTCNGPLISPLMGKHVDECNDYVKFRLVKSNSCDSRLELTGRFVEGSSKRGRDDKAADLRQCTIAETPSIEITTIERQESEETGNERVKEVETKREPPVVIGLEPKREESREGPKAEFKLGGLDDVRSNYAHRFVPTALTKWQINEGNWKATDDFGKMEFEEFEVLEDSLNGAENLEQPAQTD
ncbi:hypothetical protein KM043_017886 [Ampulex compressa]|nr:hypothetical protein KM043_017886 [Ampulex compressa]